MPMGPGPEQLPRFSGAGTPCWVEGIGECSFSAYTYVGGRDQHKGVPHMAQVRSERGSIEVSAERVRTLIYTVHEEP